MFFWYTLTQCPTKQKTRFKKWQTSKIVYASMCKHRHNKNNINFLLNFNLIKLNREKGT